MCPCLLTQPCRKRGFACCAPFLRVSSVRQRGPAPFLSAQGRGKSTTRSEIPGGPHSAPWAANKYRQTDRQNFGHTDCGCIDGATVYGSQGPALSPRPHNPSTLPTLHRQRCAATCGRSHTQLVLYSAFALWPCPSHTTLRRADCPRRPSARSARYGGTCLAPTSSPRWLRPSRMACFKASCRGLGG